MHRPPRRAKSLMSKSLMSKSLMHSAVLALLVTATAVSCSSDTDDPGGTRDFPAVVTPVDVRTDDFLTDEDLSGLGVSIGDTATPFIDAGAPATVTPSHCRKYHEMRLLRVTDQAPGNPTRTISPAGGGPAMLLTIYQNVDFATWDFDPAPADCTTVQIEKNGAVTSRITTTETARGVVPECPESRRTTVDAEVIGDGAQPASEWTSLYAGCALTQAGIYLEVSRLSERGAADATNPADANLAVAILDRQVAKLRA